ncbi:unnamed protein product [Microthlaspi erraticum]|uniref:Arabidopsis retrotransposon Orf1 C-terminal domain-containing protein n=1 Tax=Microthlaspi erraticum TaxID=1685480 RepID=A0A6D2J5D4_9BRAS|nr:unnamed protein product [Microthlaspi erraticum]
MEKGTKWNFKEKELQRFGLQSLMECTLPQGPRLLRSGAQCLRYVHKALANTFFARKAPGQSMREVKLLTWESSPSSHAQGWQEDQRERSHRELMPFLDQLSPTRSQPTTLASKGRLSVGGSSHLSCAAGVNKIEATEPGWMDIKFCKTNLSLSTRSWMGDSNSSSHIHWLALQASPAQPRAHHSSRGENIDFRPPVYTLVGHEDDLREEEPELDRAEDRAEIKLKISPGECGFG